MIAVIIAGGSGTRLWPLSTSDYPKHLLSLTGDKSLLQNTFDRAKKLTDEIYVLTDETHSHEVEKQLSQLDGSRIITEPGRKGTASCITLAIAEIAKNHGEDADVAFFHADHHIDDIDSFTKTVKLAVKSARSHDSIALIGIKPEYASTGFGYIKVGEKLNGSYWVDSFKEKPDQKTAEKYLESGDYMWNLGLFAAPVSVFLDNFKNHAPELSKAYQDLKQALVENANIKKVYEKLQNQPIDTALIEKTPHVIVVPGEFDWMDIGSFKDLHDILPDFDKLKNTVLGDKSKVHVDDTENTIVVTHNKPVAVIGLKDIVVVDTENGLLVCHRDAAQKVKQAAAKFKK